MPTTNGSQIISDDITGPEGSLVKRLKLLGCIILGKTHTVEFALGATGLNKHKGTPKIHGISKLTECQAALVVDLLWLLPLV
jgi:Asp-tRNA(Asn)/Glu-tRNA(Gln) amidotransferase A subunit family amidase